MKRKSDMPKQVLIDSTFLQKILDHVKDISERVYKLEEKSQVPDLQHDLPRNIIDRTTEIIKAAGKAKIDVHFEENKDILLQDKQLGAIAKLTSIISEIVELGVLAVDVKFNKHGPEKKEYPIA